jgi:hypothetical protein
MVSLLGYHVRVSLTYLAEALPLAIYLPETCIHLEKDIKDEKQNA